jgi:hypothetical protein
MRFAALRLGVAVALFAGWIGWLAYLSATASRPLVLSRPQFLVSDLDVIAEVNHIEPPEITIREVRWSKATQDRQLVNKTVSVKNLAECKEDWAGPGAYVLPLLSESNGRYLVAPVPRSPGFPGPGRPRIYPDTPQTRHQLNGIPKPEPSPH